MSLERVIARLVGPAEGAEATRLSPAEGRVWSQRLRAIVDADAGEGRGGTSDRGPAADALMLAAYLDGSMTAPERDAFEAELVRSPARRDELIASAAWIDTLAAQQETAPADATALAIALETPGASPPAKRGAGFAGLIEWLLPRPRLAIATSALASLAIVAVGIDVALHTHPQFRQVIQSQSAPRSGQVVTPGDPMMAPGDVRTRQMFPSTTNTDRPGAPPAQLGDPVTLTAETINALLAYRADPSPERQNALLAAMERAGSAPIPADRVRVIMLQPQLFERLTQRGDLPNSISARFSVAGELIIAIAN